MSRSFIVSLSPHIHAGTSTHKVMGHVIVALLPALGVGLWLFGLPALMVVLTSVLTALVTEALLQRFVLKTPITIADGSAALTGLLLALTLPSNTPLWIVALGSFFAIAIAKQIFGGVGKNPFNPALMGRVFLLLAFPLQMTSWPIPFSPDAVTAATPLGIIQTGVKAGESWQWMQAQGSFSVYDLIVGLKGGSLGEVSVIALLIGGLYLLLRRIITWHIPVIMIATVYLSTLVANTLWPSHFVPAHIHVLTGGLFLGAFFMATDYATSPLSSWGKVLYAFGAGVILVVIRQWGNYPEGCSFAILTMNAFVPFINKHILPRRFGTGRNL